METYYLWLSGFFAFPAVLHLVRYLAGWKLVVADNELTFNCSLAVMAITIPISVLFCYLSS